MSQSDLIFNSKYENEYYLGAKVMLDSIDTRLIQYFNDKIENTEVADAIYADAEMKSWFFEKISENITTEITLLNLIYFIMETAMIHHGDARKAQSFYVENVRNRKNYISKTIEDEYRGKPTKNNPLFLQHKCNAYFELMQVSDDLKRYDSKEEYITMLYNEIETWRKSKDSFLFQYMFFEKLPPKRRGECFKMELGANIFRIINEQYYGKINGGLTSLPSSFLDGLFTMRSEKINLDISIDDDSAYAHKSTVLKNEDGSQTTIEIEAERIYDDFSGLTEAEKKAMAKKLREENALPASTESLATPELVVLSHVYSSFTAKTLTEDYMGLRGKAFCQQVLGKKNLKIRDIHKVLSSLDKISNTDINIEKRDASGKVVAIGKQNFFTMNIGQISEEDGATYSINFDNEQESYLKIDESILMSDKWDIVIYPSAYLKASWREKVNAEIYTKQYQKIPTSKAKSYLLMLQKERLDIYPEAEKFLSFIYLRNKIRMEKVRPALMKKEIMEQLRILRDEGVVIKDFTVMATGVNIQFLPFTPLEKSLYKIDRIETIETTPDIIDEDPNV